MARRLLFSHQEKCSLKRTPSHESLRGLARLISPMKFMVRGLAFWCFFFLLILNWTSYFPFENTCSSTMPIPIKSLNPETAKPSHEVGWLKKANVDVISSKLFQNIHSPSKVIPFYFSRNEDAIFDKEDITLTTLITHDRFDTFVKTASYYDGPISVTVHITDDQDVELKLKHFDDWVKTNKAEFSKKVDIHLIVDKFPRQFNYWRNVARLYAQTDFIILLDVDFAVKTNVRNEIRNNPSWLEKLRIGKTAFVLPAVEFIGKEENKTIEYFPTAKEEVLEYVKNGTLTVFHGTTNLGHALTDFPRWISTHTSYKLTTFNIKYEPYAVYNRLIAPWCDERFNGYGRNKAACWFEMYLSGIDIWVLPNDFVIHQRHPYPEEERRMERLYNRDLYEHYREEVCERYRQSASTISSQRFSKVGCEEDLGINRYRRKPHRNHHDHRDGYEHHHHKDNQDEEKDSEVDETIRKENSTEKM